MTPASKLRPKPTPRGQKPSSDPRNSFVDPLICLLLLVAVFAVYVQVRSYSFVTFDDPIYVTENPQVRAGLSWDGLAWAFTTFRDSNWFPLTWLSHMLDYQLYGLDSGWHHLTNVFFHALSTILLFAVLKRMTAARWRSALVALMFALHPLHVESVAWVAERKDVLSALFWMLTLSAYVGYAARPSRIRYSLTLLVFCLGLMAKPMLVTLPVVFILLDLWPLRRGFRIVEKLPFFAVSLLSSIIAYIAHQKGGAVATFEVIPLTTRVENAAVSYALYILKTLWPTRLAVFYPYPLESLVVPAILAAIALLGISVLAIRTFRQRPYLAVGWFWYLVTLLPVIGLIQTGSQARADRYTYIPMIGLTIALVWGLSETLKPWPRIQVALATAVVAACFTLTWFHLETWRDDISLYQHAIRVVPDNYLARFNLAAVFEAQGRTDDAVAELREAVRVRPYYVPARAELGQLLAVEGHPDEALRELQTAVKLRPDDAIARFRLGSVLGSLGQINEAEEEFAQAIRLEPDNPDAHYNLGLALAQQGRVQEASREFEVTLRLKPDDADAHFNLGIALARSGRIDDAITQFSEALRVRPDFPAARQALDQAMSLRQPSPTQ